MAAIQHHSRVDTLELKSQIERKLGRENADKYFRLLTGYLTSEISKCEFDKICVDTIGRQNVPLHNHLLLSIIRNARLPDSPPSKSGKLETSSVTEVANGCQRSSFQSLCKDIPQSPRKGRTRNLREQKFRHRPSPLGPHGKWPSISFEDSVTKTREQQSVIEHVSLGSRPQGSVEDGEEVEQGAGILSSHSKSPIKAPLGILINIECARKKSNVLYSETCCKCGELPDTGSLKKHLDQRVEMEGLTLSDDCANVLNKALNAYLKQLIKPCFKLANSKSQQIRPGREHPRAISGSYGACPVQGVQQPSQPYSASLLDFEVAMDANPEILGPDWPTKLEKIHFRASEDST